MPVIRKTTAISHAHLNSSRAQDFVHIIQTRAVIPNLNLCTYCEATEK